MSIPFFFCFFPSPPPPPPPPHTHTHTHFFLFSFFVPPPPPPPPHILFFSLVSVSYIEWSTIPACPSPIFFLTWAVLNLKVWTLWYWCMYVLFYICVGIEFWIWLSVTLEVLERKDLHIIVWEQFWSLSLVLTGLDCPLLWPCVVDRTFRSQNPPPPPFFFNNNKKQQNNKQKNGGGGGGGEQQKQLQNLDQVLVMNKKYCSLSVWRSRMMHYHFLLSSVSWILLVLQRCKAKS